MDAVCRKSFCTARLYTTASITRLRISVSGEALIGLPSVGGQPMFLQTAASLFSVQLTWKDGMSPP